MNCADCKIAFSKEVGMYFDSFSQRVCKECLNKMLLSIKLMRLKGEI